ncbi:MAG: M64 family metallopeptidase [Nocardioidaceae bacterium]
MSTADGGIIGRAKLILGNAPPSHAFNIVLLGDGFKKNTPEDRQQDHFDFAAQRFVKLLLDTKPFDRLSAGINVYQVNVWSVDDGADDSAKGQVRRTYFDASFGAAGVQRRLVCDFAAALRVATSYVPTVNLTLVIVNTEQHGGSGQNGVAAFSLPEGAMHVGLHEAGHAVFGLADEYDYVSTDPGPTAHPAEEPTAVNLTTMVIPGAGQSVNEQRLKWRWALTPGVPVPTTAPAPGCLPNPAPSLHPVGTVGAFAGGGRYNCGVYRPEFDCKMRNYLQPFCKVCQQQISDLINSRTTLRPRARTPFTIVSRDTQHLDVFAVAADGGVMNDWWNSQHGWSGWSQVAGGRAGSGSPVTAITRYGTQIGAFTVGTDNQVIGTFWNPFSGWVPWGTSPGLTCRRGSTVTAHLRGRDHIDLFAVRQDGQVMSTWTEGKDWVPWFPISNGQVSPGSPVTAVSRSTAQVDLFTVGPDNRVWSTVWQPIVGW